MNSKQRQALRRRRDARDASGSLHGAAVDANVRTLEHVRRVTDRAVDGSRASRRRDTSRRQIGVTDLSGDLVTGWNHDPRAPIHRRNRGEAGTLAAGRRKVQRADLPGAGYWRSGVRHPDGSTEWHG